MKKWLFGNNWVFTLKLILLLVLGFVGMTIFDIGADGVETGDHNKFTMGIGVLLSWIGFARWGMLVEREDLKEKKEADE